MANAKKVTPAMRPMAAKEPRSEVMLVTPEMAAVWLGRNTEGNRTVRDARVTAFARDMTEGKWELTHQGIAFNQVGELVDGQHRLSAIVRANVSVKMLVSVGFPVEYNSMLDRGAQRTAGDILRVTNSFVAMVRCLHFLQHGSRNIRGGATVAEIAATADANDEVLRWANTAMIEKTRTRHCGVRISGWVAGAICYAWPLNRDCIGSFVDGLITGELLERSDPPYTLRNWLMRRAEKRPLPDEVTFGTCNATRYALTDTPLTRIHTGPDGYRWLTARRRAERIPNTPDTDVVEGASGGNTPRNDEPRRASWVERQKKTGTDE